MSDIQSNRDEFELLAASTNQAPFVRLNLLKFKKDRGRETYFRYIKASGPFVEAVGDKVTNLGKAGELLFGAEQWDVVMYVTDPVTYKDIVPNLHNS